MTDLAEANGSIDVVLIEEQAIRGDSYSVDPAGASASVDVRDDDTTIPVLSIAGPTNPVTEAENAVAEFVVTSTEPVNKSALNPAFPITIHYNVADHATEDFLDEADEGDKSTTEPVNFVDDGSGNYIYTIRVPVGDDERMQSNGDIKVTLIADTQVYTLDSDTNNQSASARIENEDTNAASFATPTISTNEGGMLRIAVEMSPPVTETTRVYYQILNSSTAAAVADYTKSATDYVQFIRNPYIAGTDRHTNFTSDEQQIIEIPVIEDEIHEIDETIELRLTRATGTSVVSASDNMATATISDNDTVRISVEATSAQEGDSGNTIVPVTLRLDRLSSQTFTVNLSTSIEAGDTAESEDFIAVANGTATINAGRLTGTLDVQFVGDTEINEGDETFTIKLNSITPNTRVAIPGSGNSATITIKDDDQPVLTITNTSTVEITEGENAEFTITSTKNPTGGSLSFNYTPVSGMNFLASGSSSAVPSPSLNFTADGDVYTTTLSVPTQDDDRIIEENGLLTITLSEGTGYTVGDAATASVHVSDNDAQIPTLTIAGPSAPVNEGYGGGTAVFTISASSDPGRTMDVRYTPSESGGDFLAADIEDVTVTASSLNFANSTLSNTISIPIEDDTVFENTSTITVTLEQGTGEVKPYELGNPASAMAIIQDDEIPLLSISAGPQVIEGNDLHATYIVTANKSPNALVTVGYSFDRTYLPVGDVNKSGNDTISLDFRAPPTVPNRGQISAPKTELTFTLPINPGNASIAAFANGAFEVTLQADSETSINYAVAGAPQNMASVAVADNDVPELSISAGPRVIEGVDNNATFIVTATTSPNTMLPIKYSFDREYLPVLNSNKTNTNQDYTLDFTNSKTTATITLSLNPASDTIPEFTDGEFEVTLDPVAGVSRNYAVALTPSNAATVDVVDQDALPVIEIAPKESTIAENAGPAVFTITATGSNIDGKTLRVQYKPAEVASGDFLQDSEKSGTEPLSVNLTFNDDGSGNFTQDISILLDNDEIGEATGEISVVLHDPASTTPGNQLYSLGTRSSEKVTIYDDDAPELSIADGTAVVEGTDSEASFPITAKVSPNKELTVRYTVSQPNTGYDFALSTGTTTARLDFTNGKTTAMLPIALVADNRAESSGIVRVVLEEIPATIDTGTGEVILDRQYTVSTAPGESFADVMVTDNDPTPTLTIAAPANPIAENEGAVNFVISSTVDLGTGFTVRYDPSEVSTGDYLDENASPSQEAITTQAIEFVSAGPNNFVATLAVPIHDDRVGEDTGEIQVELLVGDTTSDTYNVATDGSQIKKVTILDDNAPVLIIGDAGTVTEWTDSGISFPLTVLVSPNSGFNIKYTLEETGGDFVNARYEKSGNTRTVFFHGGNTSETLFVPIESDDIEESNSTVTVTLEPHGRPTLADAAWNLANPNRPATATIVDYLPPLATLTTEFSSIPSNTKLPFTVTVDPAPTEPILIPIGAGLGTGTGNSFSYIQALSFSGDAIHGSGIQTTILVGTSGTATGFVNGVSNNSGTIRIQFSNDRNSVLRRSDGVFVPISNPGSDATLSIIGPSTPVTLSQDATFTILASQPVASDLAVEVALSDLASKGRDFIDDQNIIVRLPANTDLVFFDVPTRIPFETVTDPDGNEVERLVTATNDGIIEAQLIDGAGFGPSPTNNVAYAEVQDPRIANPTVLTVSANATAVHQGEMVTFTVSRTGDTTNALEFKYDIIDTEDVIANSLEVEDETGTIIAGQPSLVFPALTTQDAATSYTENAGVTLRLRPASVNTAATYRVADPRNVKVGVVSVTPEIALSISPNYITEGDSFDLVATATPAAVLPITVNVTLSSSDSDNFLATGSRGAQTITIEAGQETGKISITSQADGTADNSGIITAQIRNWKSDIVVRQHPADQMTSVAVLDALPVVSISAPSLKSVKI